jgi:hypothetical protein
VSEPQRETYESTRTAVFQGIATEAKKIEAESKEKMKTGTWLSDKRFTEEERKYFLAESSHSTEQWGQALIDSSAEPGSNPGVTLDTEANKEFLLQVRVQSITIFYFTSIIFICTTYWKHLSCKRNRF